MLTREQIEKFAEDYLVKNKYPIVIPGRVTMASDEDDLEDKEYLEERGVSLVSFKSMYLDDPEHELDPGVYLVFVNIIRGDVYMPRHL